MRNEFWNNVHSRGQSGVVPGHAAPRNGLQRPGASVAGQLAFFGQDRFTPIRESTSNTLASDLAVVRAAANHLKASVKLAVPWVYALTTTPGHHASKESYGGYCFIDHAAVCCAMLLEPEPKPQVRSQVFHRVALVDVDYHAGNGSVSIFYRDPRVFCASIHIDTELDYPYNCCYADQKGEEKGEGSTLCVSLGAGTGWDRRSSAPSAYTYCEALELCCAHIRAFGATVLVVSLGVDTLEGDPDCVPLGGLCLRAPADYAAMGVTLKALGLPTIFIQEGGYRLSSSSTSSSNDNSNEEGDNDAHDRNRKEANENKDIEKSHDNAHMQSVEYAVAAVLCS